MEQLRVNATFRQRQAKGDNRRLRKQGLVPAVIYGGTQEPKMISVNHHELEMILRGARRSNSVFSLDLAEAGLEQTIIREVQRHPVTSQMVHVDFQRVDLEQEVEVSVAIHAVGQIPVGVKSGGILEHVTRMVHVRCTPLNLPKRLDADLSALEMNQSFHVSDLALPAGVTIVDEPETPLFTILPPKGEAEAIAEGGAAEPELIGRKPTEAAE